MPAEPNDFETDIEEPPNPDYTRTELRKNGMGIATGFIAFVVGSWTYVLMGKMQFMGGVALTVVGTIATLILYRLFASDTASKLDEQSVGMGKDVKPRTMGTLLGYFYNGFRH